MSAARQAPTDIFLLTGFLGSGKTTLVVDYLRHAASSNTGVIVNEVGQVNVDGAIIRSERNGIAMAEMSNGCICCTLTNDLPYTIAALFEAHEKKQVGPLKQIIVESSGLSQPSPVMRSLLSLPIPARTTVISTYDCIAGPFTTPNFEEAASQLAAAQKIVLTKIDKVPEASVRKACAATASVNPLARIIAEPATNANRAAAVFSRAGSDSFSPLALHQSPYDACHHQHQDDAYDRIGVFFVQFTEATNWPVFEEWLENLVGLCGERLLRAKGFLQFSDQPTDVLIQGVGTTFDPARLMHSSVDCQKGLVLITRDLAVEDVETVAPRLPVAVVRLSAAALGESHALASLHV